MKAKELLEIIKDIHNDTDIFTPTGNYFNEIKIGLTDLVFINNDTGSYEVIKLKELLGKYPNKNLYFIDNHRSASRCQFKKYNINDAEISYYSDNVSLKSSFDIGGLSLTADEFEEEIEDELEDMLYAGEYDPVWCDVAE